MKRRKLNGVTYYLPELKEIIKDLEKRQPEESFPRGKGSAPFCIKTRQHKLKTSTKDSPIYVPVKYLEWKSPIPPDTLQWMVDNRYVFKSKSKLEALFYFIKL